MAESPVMNNDRAFSYTLYSGGEVVSDKFRLVEATVYAEINRIGKCRLVFDAGDMPEQKFSETDSDTFKPGTSIRLLLGHSGNEKSVFEGVVVRLNLEIGEGFRSRMVVESRDAWYAATLGRENKVYENQKDSEIISSVLGKYGVVEVDATSVTYPVLVQYYATDWDFALSRADVNGFLVAAEGGKLKVKKPDVNAAEVLTVTYGVDLVDFNGGVSADEQFEAVEAVAWNPGKQTVIQTEASKPALNKQGNISDKDLELGNKYLVQTDVPLEEEVLKTWVDNLALRNGLARYRGTFSFTGHAAVVPGCLIELKGLGARFNGKVFAGAVEHTVSEQIWTTRVTMGINPSGITENTDVVCAPAGGWLPGIEGLHVGKVKQLEEDPSKEFRILVEFPLLNTSPGSVWARWATPYAGQERGCFFMPEPGDEVVVGFFNNDPTCPVILGSLYSSKQSPPCEFTADNYIKTILTRQKLKLEFDEEKKIITLVTPGEQRIELNDDSKSIRLTDKNKNEFIMNDQGIVVKSGGKIELKARSDILLEATGKLEMKAKTDVSLEGMNVKAAAKMGFTAKGNATAEISASGQTTVKGGVVMIN